MSIVTLVSIAQNIDNPIDRVGAFSVRHDMEKAGFKKIATTLGLNALTNKGLINVESRFDQHGESYTVYWLTDAGMQWLMDNQERLVFRVEAQPDDIPF